MFNRFTMIVILICTSAFFAQDGLPTQESEIFSGSGNCQPCHAPGEPNLNALRSPDGRDVSAITQWRSTMMANAARDPFWQAKVSAEVAANPQFTEYIEDKCTTCHSPMGRTQAISDGAAYYSMAEMNSDTLAMDGVSCTACHQIQDGNMGAQESWSGGYIIENWRQIYGPYDYMEQQPMVSAVHYFPVYGPHIQTSELCATCHTLFTPTIDNSGDTSGVFPEQVPYLEWRNSIYPAQDTECQTCHMPTTNFPVVISNDPDSLPAWEPYGQHYFVGANVFMLKMFKSHSEEIGVTATDEHMDSTIARTLRQLREQTLTLSSTYEWADETTLELKVALKNRAGHKFPTAYPARRAWIHLQLFDEQQQVVFESGGFDPESGEILNLDSPFEPHHDVIESEEQTQVYQALMHDVDGELTYTLLRGDGYIKDNRLPPEGFTSDGVFYDSTSIAGAAVNDDNFNRIGSVEGTGADTVTYRLSSLDGNSGYTAEVRILYQSIAPRYVADLFSYDTPEVETFHGYYSQADKTPVTVDSLTLPITPIGITTSGPIVSSTPILVNAYPNPFNPQIQFKIETALSGNLTIDIYNMLGERVETIYTGYTQTGRHQYSWNAQNMQHEHHSSGIYFLRATLEAGGQSHQATQKLVFMR